MGCEAAVTIATLTIMMVGAGLLILIGHIIAWSWQGRKAYRALYTSWGDNRFDALREKVDGWEDTDHEYRLKRLEAVDFQGIFDRLNLLEYPVKKASKK